MTNKGQERGQIVLSSNGAALLDYCTLLHLLACFVPVFGEIACEATLTLRIELA